MVKQDKEQCKKFEYFKDFEEYQGPLSETNETKDYLPSYKRDEQTGKFSLQKILKTVDFQVMLIEYYIKGI